MNTRDLTTTLPALLSELINGSPDPTKGTSMLNRGDKGLIHALDQTSARAASTSPTGGGTIASHVEHLRFGLDLLNRWARGERAPWKNADWSAAWKKSSVSDDEWRALRDDLAREARGWIEALGEPRELDERAAQWVVGSISHVAYHVGAIRQIDRATRGPTAEDELPFNI